MAVCLHQRALILFSPYSSSFSCSEQCCVVQLDFPSFFSSLTTPALPSLTLDFFFWKYLSGKWLHKTSRWLNKLTFCTYFFSVQRIVRFKCIGGSSMSHNHTQSLQSSEPMTMFYFIYYCVKCSPLIFLFICIVRLRMCQWLFWVTICSFGCIDWVFVKFSVFVCDAWAEATQTSFFLFVLFFHIKQCLNKIVLKATHATPLRHQSSFSVCWIEVTNLITMGEVNGSWFINFLFYSLRNIKRGTF